MPKSYTCDWCKKRSFKEDNFSVYVLKDWYMGYHKVHICKDCLKK